MATCYAGCTYKIEKEELTMEEQYQDIWIQGKLVSKGVRECEQRYELVKSIVKRYTRPITVLDLGANLGYFSIRLSEEFTGSFVMAEQNLAIKDVVEKNGNNDLILLRKKLTIEDIEELSRCEHFDVVLAFNIINKFPDWKRVADAVLNMGDTILIETPSRFDIAASCYENAVALYDYLVDNVNVVTVGQTPSHTGAEPRTMFLFENSKSGLQQAYFSEPPNRKTRIEELYIHSDWSTKYVKIPRKEEKRFWIRGINLRTFVKLQGEHPHHMHIAKEMLHRFFECRMSENQHHGDINIWNMVLTGSEIFFIDFNDPKVLLNRWDDTENFIYALAEFISYYEDVSE